jgi:hypothetical protein
MLLKDCCLATLPLGWAASQHQNFRTVTADEANHTNAAGIERANL